MSNVFFKWEPIQDLPENWNDLCSDTLKNMSQIWAQNQNELSHGITEQFSLRLRREWAIETGLIENLYTLDRGITQTLIEQGLDAIDIPHNATNKPPAFVKRLIKDQEDVVNQLFAFVKGDRSLTVSYIKELHAALTRSQPTTEAIDSLGQCIDVDLIKGDWKKLPNNPTRRDGKVHEYCPPIHVGTEMDQLIKWYNEHLIKGVPPEVEAAWLHHRFTQIHPFQDGNGRVARALATLVFLKTGWFPLVVLNDNRTIYIEALETADSGSLNELTTFFTDLSTKAFRKAVSLRESVINQVQTKNAILESIAKTLTLKYSQRKNETALIHLADQLKQISINEFEGYTVELQNISSSIKNNQVIFAVKYSEENQYHYFKSQLITLANKFDYYVNIEQYHQWVRLNIVAESERRCSIILSLHYVGQNFSGVMAANIFLEYKDWQDEAAIIDGPYSLCENPFLFTEKDNMQLLSSRFQEWIQSALLKGLIHWQQSL